MKGRPVCEGLGYAIAASFALLGEAGALLTGSARTSRPWLIRASLSGGIFGLPGLSRSGLLSLSPHAVRA